MIVQSGRRYRRYNSNKTRHVRTVAVLTPTQEHRIARVDNDRDRCLLTLLYHTGLRVGELVNLNYTDVLTPELRTAGETITVTGKGTRAGWSTSTTTHRQRCGQKVTSEKVKTRELRILG